MAGGKQRLSDVVAVLGETIRELREEVAALRAEKALRGCHGCHCGHVCVHPAISVQPWIQSPTITWTSQQSTVPAAVTGYVQTAASAGAAPADPASTLAIGN